MTPTPRERFEEKFDHIGDEYIYSKGTDGDFDCLDLEDVWSFIETLLEEARQEAREDFKKRCLRVLNPEGVIDEAGTKETFKQIGEYISKL